MKIKENRGVSVIAFIIVIAVIVIIASCIIVYLLNNQVKEKVAVQDTAPVTEVNSSSKEEEKTTKIETMTADEKFSIYANGMKKIFQDLGNDGMKYIYGEKVDTSEYIGQYTLSSEYFAKIDKQNNLYINDKKITSDVINITKMLHAQDGYYFFVIKNDGHIEYVVENDYKNSKYVSHKLEGFKNIVDVIEIQGVDYNKFLAIDIEGKSFEVNLWKK